MLYPKPYYNKPDLRQLFSSVLIIFDGTAVNPDPAEP